MQTTSQYATPVIFLGEDLELAHRWSKLYSEIIWDVEYRIDPFTLICGKNDWKKALPTQGRGLVFIEIPNGAKAEGMELLAKIINELRGFNPSTQIALLAEDDTDYFTIAQNFSIGNVVKKKSFDASILRALTIRLLTGNIFGFAPYFPSGFLVGPYYRTIVGRVVVEDVIEECYGACRPYVQSEEAHSFKMFLNELLLNAFSYAIEGITPVDRDSKLLHAPPEVDIPERKAIKITLVTDNEKVGFSIQDSTGSLSMLRVLQKLRRQSCIGDEKMPPGIWDESGRGISMVYRYSRFIVNILKGVRTEIIFLQYHQQELNRFESIIITEVQPF